MIIQETKIFRFRDRIKLFIAITGLLLLVHTANALFVLIPMDKKQTNHLKAYGIAYATLAKGIEVKWLLNYRGGSFLIQQEGGIVDQCLARGVS